MEEQSNLYVVACPGKPQLLFLPPYSRTTCRSTSFSIDFTISCTSMRLHNNYTAIVDTLWREIYHFWVYAEGLIFSTWCLLSRLLTLLNLSVFCDLYALDSFFPYSKPIPQYPTPYYYHPTSYSLSNGC
jgi:hypothetical protein